MLALTSEVHRTSSYPGKRDKSRVKNVNLRLFKIILKQRKLQFKSFETTNVQNHFLKC